MTSALVMGPPLLAGLVLALLAGRRGWSPPLWVALCVGAALRLLILVLVAQQSGQPYDFQHDFAGAAAHIREGRNPTMHMREGGWHFLPPLAYVLALQQYLGELLNLSWNVVGRVVPVLADLALIPLAGRLAAERGATKSFQYACVPLAVLISAYHGQLVPITLLFGVAALLAARSGRPHLAGVLIGLSVACTKWSVLLVPGVALSLTGTRRRLTVLAWTAVVPAASLFSSVVFLDTTLTGLPALAKAVMSTRPVVGDWGWTTLATGGMLTVSAELGRIGLPILVAALLAAAWWWRRAEPIDLTIALLLVFLIVTYRLGAQYLMWPLPYLIARGTPWAWPAITGCSLWAATGYLQLYRFFGVGWHVAHPWYAYSSLLVIPLLVLALPWRARTGPVTRPPAPAEPVTAPSG